jgi:hypothetical protein
MSEITRKIQEMMKRLDYRARTVSIIHLMEVQESVGKLVRQRLVNKQLHEKWHFYLDTNKDLPEAKTVVIVEYHNPLLVSDSNGRELPILWKLRQITSIRQMNPAPKNV